MTVPAQCGAAAPDGASESFVESADIRWNVRRLGRGPGVLLLHGTGSASSSWRRVMAAMAGEYELVAPDLPGHGRSTGLPAGCSTLPAMAQALSELVRTLGFSPIFMAGHSAGAAISAQMVLSEGTRVQRLAWIGAALRPLEGMTGAVATPLARLLARSRVLTRLAAWRASDDAAVRRLVEATGSTLDAAGIEDYRALLRRPSHVAGALAMMAGWDLQPLQAALARLTTGVLLVHGERDRAVPIEQSAALAETLPDARLVRIAQAGHLVHEERPAEVSRLLAQWFGGA